MILSPKGEKNLKRKDDSMRKTNKILSVILAVLLLISAMSVTAFAAEGGNTTLTAQIPCTVTLQVGDHGKVTVNSTDYTGNAGFTAAVGTALTYTFTPNTLYKVDKVIYNGTDVTGELSGNTYTAPALAGNATLSVSFKFIGGGGTDTYTVTFHANGHGTAPASQTVLDGYKAAKPADPTASGWTFGGWYKDSACTETLKYDFNTPVKANLDLYAKWTQNGNPPTPPVPVTHTVSFNMNGHGTQVPYQTVADGNKATEPVAPTASGYTFGGWYTDTALTAAYDFNSAVTADLTLYAKWTQNGTQPPAPTYYTVSFNMSGHGTQITGQSVEDGGKVTKPANPTASGYTFKGWYTDSTFQTAFDFGTAIHADTTLYAKWVTNSVTPADPTNPKTGDNSNLLLWVVLLAVSGAVLYGTAIYSRKRKHN
ncbi:MAG: InlB B-repeat-containing protein [Lachnospiraceae bacterium]|nr:InlB B-repeat-containing protein [Lachnospiraceae bacterium]